MKSLQHREHEKRWGKPIFARFTRDYMQYTHCASVAISFTSSSSI